MSENDLHWNEDSACTIAVVTAVILSTKFISFHILEQVKLLILNIIFPSHQNKCIYYLFTQNCTIKVSYNLYGSRKIAQLQRFISLLFSFFSLYIFFKSEQWDTNSELRRTNSHFWESQLFARYKLKFWK